MLTQISVSVRHHNPIVSHVILLRFVILYNCPLSYRHNLIYIYVWKQNRIRGIYMMLRIFGVTSFNNQLGFLFRFM